MPARKGVTQLDDEQAKERMALYRSGLNDGEIGRRQGVSDGAIYHWRRQHKLPANVPPGKGQHNASDARRLEAFALMDQGVPVREIRRRVGVGERYAAKWRTAYLNANPNAPRLSGQRKRTAAAPALAQTAIYGRVRRALGRALPPDLLDDAVSNMWLAVAEGRLSLDQVEAAANKFRNGVIADYASRYGPRSLDEEIGAEGDGFRMIDLIRDERSSSWLEEMGASAW